MKEYLKWVSVLEQNRTMMLDLIKFAHFILIHSLQVCSRILNNARVASYKWVSFTIRRKLDAKKFTKNKAPPSYLCVRGPHRQKRAACRKGKWVPWSPIAPHGYLWQATGNCELSTVPYLQNNRPKRSCLLGDSGTPYPLVPVQL